MTQETNYRNFEYRRIATLKEGEIFYLTHKPFTEMVKAKSRLSYWAPHEESPETFGKVLTTCKRNVLVYFEVESLK